MCVISYRPQKTLSQLCLNSVQEIQNNSAISAKLKKPIMYIVSCVGLMSVYTTTLMAQEVNIEEVKRGMLDEALYKYVEMLPNEIRPLSELLTNCIKGILLVSVGVAIVLALFDILKSMLEGNSKASISIITKYLISVISVFGVVILIITVASTFL